MSFKKAAGTVVGSSPSVPARDIDELEGSVNTEELRRDREERKPFKAGDPTRHEITLLGFTVNAGYLSLLVLVAQNASLVLLTRWSRSHSPDKGGHLYHSSTLVLVAELIKMLVCLVLLWVEMEAGASYLPRLYSTVFSMETVKLSVPALLFTLQNLLLFVSLSNLDAMTFQLLSQIKLLLAALFSVWLLDRYLTCVQWTSVVMLTAGIVISSQGQGSEKAASASQNMLLGIVACVVSGTSSAFASVYFEKILKTTKFSIAVRNIQLGIFSIVLSVISIFIVDGVPERDFHFFQGYHSSTWVLACLHAGGGILVAVVVKYADNILKGFSTGVAIIVSGVYASLAWGFAPSGYFIVGALVVTLGTSIYNIPDPRHPTVEKLARMMPGGYRIPKATQDVLPV